MDEIKQIYFADGYSDFLRYCELHNFRLMRDLQRCPFDELPALTGISPAVLSRIRTIYLLYFKNHPECAVTAKKSAAKPKSGANLEELRDRLLVYFQQNADRLIRISEITKSLGKSARRSDIVRILERQNWCRIVDGSTFFILLPIDA